VNQSEVVGRFASLVTHVMPPPTECPPASRGSGIRPGARAASHLIILPCRYDTAIRSNRCGSPYARAASASHLIIWPSRLKPSRVGNGHRRWATCRSVTSCPVQSHLMILPCQYGHQSECHSSSSACCGFAIPERRRLSHSVCDGHRRWATCRSVTSCRCSPT
jgi:hypothetical protein